ncbi:MAG TPA: DUF4115 domain-containing protein [bacterium]|jgi:cytoskeletal protein RodZ|nr:DUF4115 domain-containing protein [bacterium]HNT64710.1 DUF4115 domain-containing protein [bacterium]
MNTDRHRVVDECKAIGKELAQRREAKRLSLEQVSAKTKISVRFLKSMEAGDFSFLPMTYSQAFLKTVSLLLGLDPGVMAERLLSAQTPTQPTKPSKSVKATKRRLPSMNKPIVWGVAGLAIVVLLLPLFKPKTRNADHSLHFPTTSPSAPTAVTVEPPVAAKAEQKISMHSKPAPIKRSVILLEATAVETTWVRVVYRDSLVDDAIFYPGDFRVWSSETPLYLKIGNAAGLRLKMNEQELGVPGRAGRITNIRIDATGMAAISPQDFPNR